MRFKVSGPPQIVFSPIRTAALLLLPSLFLLSAMAPLAQAQVTSGNIAGVVKDPTGAAIPNATVVVKSEATGVAVTVTTNGSGQYVVQNLLPARYDITATTTGFSPTSLTGVTVSLNSTASADLALSTGGATSTVEVSATSADLLDTTTQNLTTSFTNQELSLLPTTSQGFGVLNASLLAPGVTSSGGIGIGTGPSVGGQRPRNNNFTIEGIDNNDKAVTGPLVVVPNDAVGSFTLITSQFSPEFGHSSGGQFNTNVISGTNSFHGKLYEYFQNRNLNAGSGTQGGKPADRPRYDNNRYGGQLGGPLLRNKLFFFGGFERHLISQNPAIFSCVPTAAGLATLQGLAGAYGFNQNNLAQYLKYSPTPNTNGGTQVTAANDVACGAQSLTVFQGTGLNNATGTYGSGASTSIPLGNYQSLAGTPETIYSLTTSGDYTISDKDSLRLRYLYVRDTSTDTNSGAVVFPIFFTPRPDRYQLATISEYHNFSPNLVNEFRIGFNRHSQTISAGNFSYPGLDQFPNLTFIDQGQVNYGPDGNAPSFTVQNLYQLTENISYTRGSHTFKFGFDGRKYISPQGFTQRARGDYQWDNLTEYLHDLAPTYFGERSTGNLTYYGDQTALYGYGNDTWRATDKLTLNYGLRYEFTSVPVGERAQSINSAASIPGLITFGTPQPTYTSFAPRVGVGYAPDTKTNIRAGFGLAYDVIFDNLGTLSFPPQYSITNDVGNANSPAFGAPNFLANGGLLPGNGGIGSFPTIAAQRAATSAYIPNQVTPYAETWTLTIQRTFSKDYTFEVGYEGNRGVHLPTQDQINVQPKVTPANALPTYVNGVAIAGNPGVSTLSSIQALSNRVPGYAAFTGKVTSYQPYSSSNYNGLLTNLTRRFSHGLQANLSYTWSKALDDATAEVFATTLTPRRPLNSQNVAGDYSRSALDRTHRVTMEALYDFQLHGHDNFFYKSLLGNWTFSPIYTYESPEYVTVLSTVNPVITGDSPLVSRVIVNRQGVRGTSSLTTPITNATGDTIGYNAVNPNAYYIQANVGTYPNDSRNSLPTRPIDNIDFAAYKRLTFRDHYSFEFGAQAFNVLNHAQYTPGTVNNINTTSNTSSYALFQTVGNAFFNQPGKVFLNNARTMQLSAKIAF